MPERPGQEFVVAIAGPVVNVAIAASLFLLLSIIGRPIDPFEGTLAGGFFSNLMWVNVALVIFNMLPAFPMDGGRILRATLGAFTTYERSTRIAAAVGQTLAVGLAILGLFGNPMLLLIAAFVFFGAGGEAQIARMRSKASGLRALDAMLTRFTAFPAYLSVDAAAQSLTATTQRDFPVTNDGKLVGMLRRGDLLAALEAGRGQASVIETMRTDFAVVESGLPLFEALQKAGEAGSDIVAVVNDGRLIGLLDTTAAIEVATTRSRLSTSRERPIVAEVVQPTTGMSSARM
jgi:CBS domain-containing protein